MSSFTLLHIKKYTSFDCFFSILNNIKEKLVQILVSIMQNISNLFLFLLGRQKLVPEPLSFGLRDNKCIFSFLSTFSRFNRASENRIIYDVMMWYAGISRYNFWNDSKTAVYYIIKLGQLIHPK